MEQIADDHLALRLLLRAIDGTLSEERSRDAEQLTVNLETLTKHLAKHFKQEEMSELYLHVPQRMPELAEQLAALKVDHGTLLELAIDASGAAGRLVEAQAEVTQLVSDLVEKLRDHESAESEIIQRAFAAE